MSVTPGPGSGYDPDFLARPLPLPTREERAEDLVRLDYTHFSVVLDTRRRLAALTAVNVDGAALRDVGRSDDWYLDPRVTPEQQAGPALYARNDLDRGHLVRRRDPVWGEQADAERANVDTFAYPNAAPQAAGFNQSLELWLGLEDHVLRHAEVNGLRLSVLTGPVLADEDPVYRGVQLPRLFYKVAAWTSDDALSAAAFVLDQTPQLDDVDLATQRALLEGRPPPLGPFRTFQVPVRDVEALTGLLLGPLVAADAFRGVPAPAAAGAGTRRAWSALSVVTDVDL